MHLWSTSSTAAVLFHTFFLTIYTFVFYKFNQDFGVDVCQWCKSSVSGYETFFPGCYCILYLDFLSSGSDGHCGLWSTVVCWHAADFS